MSKKNAKLIGTTQGVIQAVNVMPTQVQQDAEMTNRSSVISLIDDSGTVCVYDCANLQNNKPNYQHVVCQTNNLPECLKERDPFGLGYPY